MRWYDGSIENAVTAAKARGAIFVVLIEGFEDDDATKRILTLLNHPEINTTMQSETFVAVRVPVNSAEYRYFVQMYAMVPIPSMFFIGSNGTPLEVITSELTVEQVVSRIQAVLHNHQLITPGIAHRYLNPCETADQPMETESEILKQESEQVEENMEHDQQQQEEEKEPQHLQRSMEPLRTEMVGEPKVEEGTAEQILDKTTPASENYASKPDQQEGKKESVREDPVRSIVARIQFRLPDGSTYTEQFQPTNILLDIRNFVRNNVTLPFRDFTLLTTFPRRQFTHEDDNRTLADLMLTPSSVIMILQASTGAEVLPANDSSFVSRVFWALVSPLLSVYEFLRVFLFPQPRNTRDPSDDHSQSGVRNNQSRYDGSNPEGTGPSPSGNGGARRRMPMNRSSNTGESGGARRRPYTPMGGTSAVKQEGNIHRLTDVHDSSDDDNNTWNGNSTQQM